MHEYLYTRYLLLLMWNRFCKVCFKQIEVQSSNQSWDVWFFEGHVINNNGGLYENHIEFAVTVTAHSKYIITDLVGQYTCYNVFKW